MAYIKYAGEEAVGRIAEYVNKKLAFASTMPESPDTNTIILYVGADTSSYSQGGIYQYDGTDWSLINLVKTIELTMSEYDSLPEAAKNNGVIYFVTDANAEGTVVELTQAEYDALSPEAKSNGTIYFVTDASGINEGSVASGYYNELDGEFYSESTYETRLEHNRNVIYIDLNTNTTYIYDFTDEKYVQVGGGSEKSEVIKYVNILPTTEIEDIIYGVRVNNPTEEIITNNFLDNNELFIKQEIAGGGYAYTAATGVIFYASIDNIEYKKFASLEFDDISDWDLTFSDLSNVTLSDGDNIYFNQIVTLFYAGDSQNQITIPLATEQESEKDIIEGYYNSADEKFYEDSSYTVEIPGDEEKIFITLDTNYIYRYDNTSLRFIQIGGSSNIPDAIVYIDTLPITNIENVIYAMITRLSYSETVGVDFLDSYDNIFDKEITGGGYVYTPISGIELVAGTDGINFKELISITYDNALAHFTIAYKDGTSNILTDTLYFKQTIRTYYAGNKEEQTVTLLNMGNEATGTTYYPGEGIDITNKIISVAPATTSSLGGVKPDNNTIIINSTGTIEANYQEGNGIRIEGNVISDRTFVGTQAEWDALSPTEQAEFDVVTITDDSAPVMLTPGHTIVGMPQRSGLQFEGAETTDDSTNDVTKITVTPYTAGDGIEIDDHEVSVTEDRPATFVGTTQEWDALTAAEKAQYKIVNLTNDVMGGETVVVDTVEDGNLNPVTSNAVYDALKFKPTQQTKSINGSGTITFSLLYRQPTMIFIGPWSGPNLGLYLVWPDVVNIVKEIAANDRVSSITYDWTTKNLTITVNASVTASVWQCEL